MNDDNAMKMLTDANPVRAQELDGLSLPDSVLAGHRPRRRLMLAAVVVAGAIAASLIGFFAFGGSPKQQPRGARSAEPLPTLAHPLPHPDAKEITLSDATQALGAPIVLPDNSLASASDVGAIWTQRTGPVTDVAVTFPRAGLIVNYERPIPYPQPVPEMYAILAKQSPDSTSVIDLHGVPALATLQNSDQLHQNFGAIEFVENATVVSVMGHYETATLQAVAQSILDRAPAPAQNGTNLPGIAPSRKRISLAKASAAFGAPVVLPGLSLVNPATVKKVWAMGKCPRGGRNSSCSIWVFFPSLTLIYSSPVWPRTRRQYEIEARHMNKVRHQAEVIDLNGVPALAINENIAGQHNPGWIYFVVAGTRVVVAGERDMAQLQAIAQSIVDRSK